MKEKIYIIILNINKYDTQDFLMKLYSFHQLNLEIKCQKKLVFRPLKTAFNSTNIQRYFNKITTWSRTFFNKFINIFNKQNINEIL